MAQTNVQAFSGDVEISSNLAVDTNTLFVDSVGNKVGIGTDNPDKKLHVNDIIYSSAGVGGQHQGLRVTNTNINYGSSAGIGMYVAAVNNSNPGASVTNTILGNIDTVFGNATEAYMRFFVSPVNSTTVGDAKMVIKNNGNVGIGTNNPIAALDIVGGAPDDTTPALSIGGGNHPCSDLYVLNSLDTETGVGYGAKVIGVNIKNKVETDNTLEIRRNDGGLTSAGALYLGTDDREQGIFGVLGGDGAAGTALSEFLTIRSTGNVGLGTTNPDKAAHLYYATTVQTNGLLIENMNPASGTASTYFCVASSGEGAQGKPKAAIMYERTAANGQGKLLLCVDASNDNNEVGPTDSLITLKNNYYVGFGLNLEPAQHFHFARNTEDDHLYVQYGKARSNQTSGYWKPYMYAAANSSSGQYAGATYYSNHMFIGCGQMEVEWGSNYYGGTVDIRAGNVRSSGNNGSAHSTNYNAGHIVLQGGVSTTGNQSGFGSRTFGGSIIFKTQNANKTYANIDQGAYERMRVDGDTGRVGIAVTAPLGTLHVEANDRVHFTRDSSGVFAGLEVTTSRAQVCSFSDYSDTIIASRAVNNSHGSTLSLTAVNPSNHGDYRKFVIGQGGWGSRKQMLEFGYADGSYSNPHSVLNSTGTVMTLDGVEKRVGIKKHNPSYTLDVGGSTRSTSTIHANSGVELPTNHGYCAIIVGTGDGASYSIHNSTYRTWWGIGVRDYANTCRILLDARAGSILGTGTVGSTSDDRIKINEKRITRATDTISKLDPQLYHKTNKSSILAKEGEEVLYQTESGLIAQDIWYDAPELRHLVLLGTGADPAIEKPYRNPDITIDPDYSGWGPEPATVNYIGLIPYLIKSVQEIATEVPNVKTGVSNVNVSNVDNYHGLIVSANKPDTYISTSSYDTKCYGVVSEENVDTINNEILINTSRDGKVWVIDVENLQSGDYITTSNVAGYGMKQSDDLVHNYTVAKILQDCDFNPTQVPVKRVVRETRDVTYYVKREYIDLPQDGSEAYIHDNKIVEIDEVYYVKSSLVSVPADEDYTSRTFTPEITEEAYDALDESDRESYTVEYFKTEITDIKLQQYESLSASEKEECEQMTRKARKILKLIETKEPLPGYEIETRTEEVDVLDSNGQLVWEQTGETRASYTIKNIDATGAETDEANAVHKAALVNCKVVL